MPRDHYTVLGVRKNASAQTIRKNYRKRAADAHPDKNPGDDTAEACYREITEAYEVLSDPARRKKYDETGDGSLPRTSETTDLLNVLVPHLMAVIQDCANAGIIKTTDIVKRVLRRVDLDRGNCEDQLKGMNKALQALRDAAGRFETPGEDNLLEGVVRSQIVGLEAQIAHCVDATAKLQKALDYLALCKYRTDGSDPMKSILGGLSYKTISWRAS